MRGDKILVFVSSVNTKGKHDATGAFLPEAAAFCDVHNVPEQNITRMNCTKSIRPIERAAVVYSVLLRKRGADLEGIAFFGHGWPRGIQFGFNRRNVDLLAQRIADASAPNVKIGLFTCLTAENDVRDETVARLGPATDGGFADLLRDDLVRHGVTHGWVDAHKTAGHTTRNPYVVRFLCDAVQDPRTGAMGGAWLVAPGSRYWGMWIKRLRDTLRFHYMFIEELTLKTTLSHYMLDGGIE